MTRLDCVVVGNRDVPIHRVSNLVHFLERHSLNVALARFDDPEHTAFKTLLAEAPTAVAIMTTFRAASQPIVDIARFVRAHSPRTTIIVEPSPAIALRVCAAHAVRQPI